MPLIRDDLTTRLIHLTKGENLDETAERFVNILVTKSLLGNEIDVRGSFKCVCFSETPISKIAQVANTASSDTSNKFGYAPFGVKVTKQWLFEKGGRPAIYGPEDKYSLLPEQLAYRFVKYNPPKVDYTWEREWRIRSEKLELDPVHTTLIVPDRITADGTRSNFVHKRQIVLRSLGPRYGIFPHVEFPWNLIALEDLGYS